MYAFFLLFVACAVRPLKPKKKLLACSSNLVYSILFFKKNGLYVEIFIVQWVKISKKKVLFKEVAVFA